MAGTLRERSPGHFQLRAYNKTTGKQVTRTYHHPKGERGTGIRAAQRELARLVTEVEDGKHGGSKSTVVHLLTAWLAQADHDGRSPNTLHGYKAKAKRITDGPLGKIEVAKLKPKDIGDWYNDLRTGGMTPANLMHHHRVLRAALGQAERWEWIVRNPARAVKPPTVAKAELHAPTIDEARALVLRAEKTGSPDLGPILLFGMLTGMRRGELCGIQWSDIDWPTRRVTVRRAIWQVRSEWGVKDPKTHQVRTIALDDVAVVLLTGRLERAEVDAEAAGIELPADGFVWSTAVDGHSPRTPNSLTRAFHRLCRTMEDEAKAADPPRVERWDFRFHDLRHLSATRMIAQGMDPRTVAARLGHADASVTLRVYAHAVEERDRDAADLLGRELAPPR